MTRLQLITRDFDDIVEVSLQTAPDVVHTFDWDGRDDDGDATAVKLEGFEDDGVVAISVYGVEYTHVFDRKTKTAYSIHGFKASSAEELMLKIDAKGLGETVPDPPQTPAGVKALAAENRKLKDKIAKMREMLK